MITQYIDQPGARQAVDVVRGRRTRHVPRVVRCRAGGERGPQRVREPEEDRGGLAEGVLGACEEEEGPG